MSNFVELNEADNLDIDLSEVKVVTLPVSNEEIVIEPKVVEQVITPSRPDLMISKATVKAVTSEIDENIQPENIVAGKTILGVEGNASPGKPSQTKTTTPTKERQFVRADAGFELVENIVEPIPDEYIIPAGAVEIKSNGRHDVKGVEFADVNVPTEIPEGYINPQGTIELKTNGEHNVREFDKALVNVPTPEGFADVRGVSAEPTDILAGKTFVNKNGELKSGTIETYGGSTTIVPTKARQVVETQNKYVGANIEVKPIGDEYVIPEGEILITDNNRTYDVTNSKTAKIEVPVPEPKLQKGSANENGVYTPDEGFDGFSEFEVDVASSGGGANGLQWKCDNMNTLEREFYGYQGEDVTDAFIGLDTRNVTSTYETFYNCKNITSVPLFNTENVKNMGTMFKGCTKLTTIPAYNTSSNELFNYMFQDCTNLTTIPLLDTSKGRALNYMFSGCANLSSVPQLDTSSATTLDNMFYGCKNLTQIPAFNTSNNTSMRQMFYRCSNLTTIPLIDMIKVTGSYDTNQTFNGCANLTNLTLKNIKTKIQIGSGTSFGHLLTDASLINTAKELWDLTGSTSQTLTVSTPSNARFDQIYVKLITATDEMIAEDQYINNKKPCVVCESTDEGAMTLREYVVSKNWALA